MGGVSDNVSSAVSLSHLLIHVSGNFTSIISDNKNIKQFKFSFYSEFFSPKALKCLLAMRCGLVFLRVRNQIFKRDELEQGQLSRSYRLRQNVIHQTHFELD